MKQVLLFGFGLLLVAVVVGLYMRPDTPLDTQALSESGTTSAFMLYRTSGDVFYKKEGDNNFSPIGADEIRLPNKTSVKTAKGRAYVLFEDTSIITIKENTEIVVTMEDDNISIKQMFGKTYHRVQTLLIGKSYEVRTPTTLAAVRGTKFAVSYDEVKKETKIAVTESKVAVKDVEDMNSTSTVPLEEFTMVEEGEIATINSAENSGPKDRPITLSKTEDDDEMREMVEDEIIMDEVFESGEKSSDQQEFKRKLEEVIIEEKKKEVQEKTMLKESEEVKKEEDRKSVIEVAKEEIKEQNNEVQRENVAVVKKLDEEAFFNKFEPLFVRLFYLDDQMEPCAFKGLPEDRVREIATLAKESGYPLTSTVSLTAFAKDIAEYCSTKEESVRMRLQTRFDSEYPYRQ
jgi:hypothetical protein